MEVLKYFIFSFLEWVALLTLSFVIFRFPFRGYVAQLIFTASLLSVVSYLIFKVFHLQIIAPALQLPIVFLFFWIMFRLQFLHSAIVTTYGYIGYVIIQYPLVLIIEWFWGIGPNELLANVYYLYIVQFTTIVCTFSISWVLHRYRLGFSFVLDKEPTNGSFYKDNIRFILLAIVASISIALLNISALHGYLVHLFIFMAFVLFFLLHVALQREITTTKDRMNSRNISKHDV